MTAAALLLLLAGLDPAESPHALPSAGAAEWEVRWDASGAVPAVLGLEPGRASLDDVRRAAGEAPRLEGDPGARDAPPVRLCYVPQDGGDATALLFDAQYDARGERVEAYVLADGLPPEVRGAPCAPSAPVHRGLALSNGMRLGMSPAEAIACAGPPTGRSGAELAWERWTGRAGPDGVAYDGYEGMRLVFVADRLISAEAFRAEWRR